MIDTGVSKLQARRFLLMKQGSYRKTHTAMETAGWLELTRQTFYRKLKQHRENGDDGKV